MPPSTRQKQHPNPGPASPPTGALTQPGSTPLVRDGLTITAGIIAGNLTGFARVAITAYLLGTERPADALAVSLGPLDTFNHALISTIVFAFVPMLAARQGASRAALFQRLYQAFAGSFLALNVATLIFAPWLIEVLAPGLASESYDSAVALLRIGSFSITAIGAAALHSALLYTERRFAPSAFHQATINAVTVILAAALWSVAGVAGFAAGYTAGAWVQLLIVWRASRASRIVLDPPRETVSWTELIAKPGAILIYSGLLALNLAVTRAYATHLGPGTAAAFEYSLRCIGVPLAFLVSPISNSMLPEIARLRSARRLGEAFRLVDRTLLLAGSVAVAACALGIWIRRPVIALLFERGSFTEASTQLVGAAFLGLAPSLIGWSLLDLTSRSVFAIDRTWLPVGVAVIPVVLNLTFLATIAPSKPEYLGLGASIGLLAGFLALFQVVRSKRRWWIEE